MNTVENGIRNYRTNDLRTKPQASAHPLDVLSSILFVIKTENRQRESDSSPGHRRDKNNEQEDFREVLKKEMSK